MTGNLICLIIDLYICLNNYKLSPLYISCILDDENGDRKGSMFKKIN